jgi:hypothetical protein
VTPELLRALIGQSAGVGVGMFLGALIGLSVRRRGGKQGGLFRDSILATAFLAGAAAMAVMMVITYFRLV